MNPSYPEPETKACTHTAYHGWLFPLLHWNLPAMIECNLEL